MARSEQLIIPQFAVEHSVVAGIMLKPLLNRWLDFGAQRERFQRLEYFIQQMQKYHEQTSNISPAVVFGNQVHGSSIQHVTSVTSRYYLETDGLITSTPNCFLHILVADCIPIFLYDPSKNAIAALHAGWKGTYEKIALNGVALFQSIFQSDTSCLRAYIGPGASSCCYHVSADFANRFPNTFRPNEMDDRAGTVDLKEENRIQLVEAGLRERYIQVSGICTICRQDICYSHRYLPNTPGRMIAYIGNIIED